MPVFLFYFEVDFVAVEIDCMIVTVYLARMVGVALAHWKVGWNYFDDYLVDRAAGKVVIAALGYLKKCWKNFGWADDDYG